MTISPRLEVMKALTAKLKEITPANGFDFDLSEAVFRGRMTFGEDDPIPMVSILEAPNPKPNNTGNGGGNCASIGPWEIIIQGFVQDTFDNPTDPGYILLEEVKMKLREAITMGDGFNILGLGKTVQALNIGGGVVRPPDEASSKAYFWLVVTLTIVE